MTWAVITLLLLLSPSAHALNCNSMADTTLESCNDIMQSSLNTDEKKHLTANLIYKERDHANHDFIYDWNTNINFNSAPHGVETKSSGYIKDAWLKIITVMPSVISEDKLLTPGIGKVLSAYNYRVEIPSEKEPGDCKTEFDLRSSSSWLSVYLNGNLIGTSTLTDFEGSPILNFEDNLRIQTVTEIKHYKTHRWCCSYDRSGGCKRYCEECKYRDTEDRVHEVNLEDAKQAEHYWPGIFPEIKAVDKYHNTTVGILNISDFDAFSLDFEDSYFEQNNYFYDVNVSIEPYDVFTLRANKFTNKEANNLNVEQFNETYKFYVANPENCKLKFYDHFHAWEQDCNLEQEFPLFKVKTDKLQYDEDETIKVEVEPKNTEIRLKYGDDEITARNNAEFKAKYPNNKITAYHADRETQEIIHVKNNDHHNVVINFGVFSGVMYFVYFFVKKYGWFLL